MLIEVFEIIEKIIGHVAWPIAVLLIFRQFSDELKLFIRRIKNAKYKGVEIDLEKEIQEIRSDAERAGITIAYPKSSFPEDSIENLDAAPEWAFIKSWQEIESVLVGYYLRVSELKSDRVSIMKVLNYLEEKGLINSEMSMLVKKLNSTRNLIVYNPEPNVTRGEALEWLGIAKSVKDRLEQKLQ